MIHQELILNKIEKIINSNSTQQVLSEIIISNYAETRNYLDGHVSCLSPLITHGVIPISTLVNYISLNFPSKQAEAFLFQLGWREYFLKIWAQDDVTKPLRLEFESKAEGVPEQILNAKTGLDIIDQEIKFLKDYGYLHNHSRLWVASLASNIYQGSWLDSAKWMYYHLLDGCPASNFLSWQWVAGHFSPKKYLFNQDNLNKFSKSTQKETFIDLDYHKISALSVKSKNNIFCTKALIDDCLENLSSLASVGEGEIYNSKEILLYSIFTLDPNWRSNSNGLRLLFLDPEFFRTFPIGKNRINLIEKLIKLIPNLKVYFGTLDYGQILNKKVFLKEHPYFKFLNFAKDNSDYILKDLLPNKNQSYFWYWKRISKSLNLKD